MNNNISLTLMCIFALLVSSAASAEGNVPADEGTEPSTAEQLLPAQVLTTTPLEQIGSKPEPALKPNNDSLVDYRHCLDLTTNAEIAACVYKNR